MFGTLDLRRWSRVWARVDWPVEAGGSLDGGVEGEGGMGMGIGCDEWERRRREK